MFTMYKNTLIQSKYKHSQLDCKKIPNSTRQYNTYYFSKTIGL